VFVKIGVINAHSPFFIFLLYKDWVCQSLRIIHLFYKSSYKEPLYFYPNGLLFVAAPSKSYGPHVPIIVLPTSDSSTCKTNNFGSLSGVLGEPQIIHVFLSSKINYRNIAVLQQLYNMQ
jgi:hypothetical protein